MEGKDNYNQTAIKTEKIKRVFLDFYQLSIHHTPKPSKGQ
jgi:hypothetical protein